MADAADATLLNSLVLVLLSRNPTRRPKKWGNHCPLCLLLYFRYGAFDHFSVLGGAATCSEGFVNSFLKVTLVYLGNMAAAVQPSGPGELSENIFKWPPHPVDETLPFQSYLRGIPL